MSKPRFTETQIIALLKEAESRIPVSKVDNGHVTSTFECGY